MQVRGSPIAIRIGLLIVASISSALAHARGNEAEIQCSGDVCRAELVTNYGSRPPPTALPLGSIVAVPAENPPERSDPGSTEKAKPDSQGNSNLDNCGQESPSSGNPVVIATGEKYKVEADFESNGLYGLSLTRTYRSNNASGRMFGANWLSNLDPPRLVYTFTGCVQTELGCLPSEATLIEPDGTKYRYTLEPDQSGTYRASGAAATGQLRYIPSSRTWYAYRDKNKTRYEFPNRTSATKVVRLGGATLLTYTYDAYGNVSKVTNAVGQAVTFTYQGSRVSRIADPANNA